MGWVIHLLILLVVYFLFGKDWAQLTLALMVVLWVGLWLLLGIVWLWAKLTDQL
jgi:hypothetical protein